MSRVLGLTAAAALAAAALLPAAPASACHEVFPPVWVDTPAGPVGFAGIVIPC